LESTTNGFKDLCSRAHRNLPAKFQLTTWWMHRSIILYLPGKQRLSSGPPTSWASYRFSIQIAGMLEERRLIISIIRSTEGLMLGDWVISPS